MRKHSTYFRAILFLVAVAVFGSCHGFALAAEDQAQGQSAPFFSQGQAVYNPQDQAQSRQQAIQDFMGQALTQAAGQFMSPSQMGTEYPELQKKILAHAQKYVDSYQVFSETQAGGLYRVVGQVTVSMDLLRKDLEESGFPVAEAGREKPVTTAAAPGSTGSTTPGTAPVPGSARGLSVTKKEILWVVPEKWEQDWIIPSGKRDAQSLFAQGIIRELDDYDYTLHFPEPGSVKMDYTGNIPRTQVITLAQGLGIQEAVVGSVALKQERNKLAKLQATLRVLKVSGGKAAGEVTREVSMEEVSNQEGALDLASRIAPQLNNLLGGTGEGKHKTASTGIPQDQQAGSPGTGPPPETPGRWTLNLPSAQYPYWKEMERALREQFKGMRIASLEMGLEEGTVSLAGVDGNFISNMNGTSLPSGAVIRVESFSAESQVIKLSFTPPANVQAEPKQ